MPSMNTFRNIRNEFVHIGDIGPATDDPFEDTFVYYPDPSELAIVEGIESGRYDETGGEVGNEEQQE